MENDDFVKELGYLGFTMRLKRVTDLLLHSGRSLYQELGLDIEPNWYVIFKLLKSRGPMCVTDIADAIKMAHPSVITLTNKMMNAGYLTSTKSETDSRKRNLSLSQSALDVLPQYEKIWDAGEKGVEEALGKMNALEFITSLEDIFFDENFKERTLKQLQ